MVCDVKCYLTHDITPAGFWCQAEDGIRDLVRSRGLGDVYKRQLPDAGESEVAADRHAARRVPVGAQLGDDAGRA